MDISELKNMKKQSSLTNQEIADLSGIPVSTINKIFSGATQNPRYATLLAIEQVLATKEKIPFTYDELKEEPVMLREQTTPYMYRARTYQERDIEELSEWARAELIDGKLYMLSVPNRMHQYIVTKLLYRIEGHIEKKKGTCHVYPSPFDVRLFANDTTVVQPDILVVCNKDILTDKGCSGAPDWIIEITSDSNAKHDYITKMMKYQKAGVREYWIVSPQEEKVFVYNFEDAAKTEAYTYEQMVPSGVLEGLEVRIRDFLPKADDRE